MTFTRFFVSLFIFVASIGTVHARDVYLVTHEKTNSFFTTNGGNHDLLSGRWRDGLARIGQPVQNASLNQIAQIKQPGVLILPSTFLLDEADRTTLKNLVASGWSLLATWATGSRDGAGNWTGYGFIEETFGNRRSVTVSNFSSGIFGL